MTAARTTNSNEPGGRAPAPGDLRIVQQFINSLDREAGVDHLDSPEALGKWLRVQGLVASTPTATQADLRRARELRELLRQLALANNQAPAAPQLLEAVDKAFAALPLVGGFSDGSAHLVPVGTGVRAALAHLVAIVVSEAFMGRWQRLKGCAREECHWAFYDHSRSGNGIWCTMAICGSRTKAKAYYRRLRSGGATDDESGARPSRGGL